MRPLLLAPVWVLLSVAIYRIIGLDDWLVVTSAIALPPLLLILVKPSIIDRLL